MFIFVQSNKKLELTEKLERELHLKKGLHQQLGQYKQEVQGLRLVGKWWWRGGVSGEVGKWECGIFRVQGTSISIRLDFYLNKLLLIVTINMIIIVALVRITRRNNIM